MSDPIIITRDKVQRGWSDLEPKIAIAGAVGFLSLVGVLVANSLDVKLPPEVMASIPICLGVLCGYLTPSSGTVITKQTINGKVEESHTGASVTTFTAPTAVQSKRTNYETAMENYVPENPGTPYNDPPTPEEFKTEVLPGGPVYDRFSPVTPYERSPYQKDQD